MTPIARAATASHGSQAVRGLVATAGPASDTPGIAWSIDSISILASPMSRRNTSPARVVSDHRGEHLRHRLAAEGWRPGKHLEEHATKGPDVGALVDRQPFLLLGRHVRRGAEDDALAGRRGVARRRALGVQHVARLRG